MPKAVAVAVGAGAAAGAGAPPLTSEAVAALLDSLDAKLAAGAHAGAADVLRELERSPMTVSLLQATLPGLVPLEAAGLAGLAVLLAAVALSAGALPAWSASRRSRAARSCPPLTTPSW